jgi:hypothetical protein
MVAYLVQILEGLYKATRQTEFYTSGGIFLRENQLYKNNLPQSKASKFSSGKACLCCTATMLDIAHSLKYNHCT